MRILFTTESYYPIIDGGAVAQHRIVHELIKRGHDVRVIAPGTKFKNYLEEDDGSTIYRSRGIKLPLYMNGKYNFSAFPFFYVKKVIEEFKPDILNVNSTYPISLCAINISKKKGIPIVGSIHILPENMLSPFLNSSFYSIYRKYAWKYLIYYFNLVDWATIPTKTGADIYKKRGLKTNITPISNGVDTEVFKPRINSEYLRKKIGVPTKKIVLYTGRIIQEKNIEVLINAIPRVIEKLDAHFLFCGSGGNYRKKIIRMTKFAGVSKNTTFIDFLERDDYENIYSLADVYVMPSKSELQSISTMEAIATGLPVLVANDGALYELVEGENGFVFESGNSEQLAEYIIKILTNDNLREKMSKNGIKMIQKHSIKYVGRNYENVYINLLDNFLN